MSSSSWGDLKSGACLFSVRDTCVWVGKDSAFLQCLLPSGHPIAIWISRLVILAVQGQSQGRVALFKPHGKTSVASSRPSTFYVCNSLGCGLNAFHVLVCLLGFLAKPGIRWPGIILEGTAPVSIPKRRPMWWGGLIMRAWYRTRANSCPFKSQHGEPSAPGRAGVMVHLLFCLKIGFITRLLKGTHLGSFMPWLKTSRRWFLEDFMLVCVGVRLAPGS